MNEDGIQKIISWWETELNGEERTQLMAEYKWHDPVEERHKKLREMYQTYNSDSFRSNDNTKQIIRGEKNGDTTN